MNRRQLLAGLAGGGLTLMTGCTSGCDGSAFVVRTAPANGSADMTVRYSDLTPAEQAFVDQTIEDGEYTDCYSDTIPEPTNRFVERVSERAVDMTAYLRRGEENYALYVQLTDKVYAVLPQTETDE